MKQIYLSILIISNLLIGAQNNLNDHKAQTTIFVYINNNIYKCSDYEFIVNKSSDNDPNLSGKLKINLTNCSNLIDDHSPNDPKYQNSAFDWIENEKRTTSPTANIENN
jgi:hypothetical protein